MGRGAWWATVHGVAEVDRTEHARMHCDGRVEHLSRGLSGLQSLNYFPCDPFWKKFADLWADR